MTRIMIIWSTGRHTGIVLTRLGPITGRIRITVATRTTDPTVRPFTYHVLGSRFTSIDESVRGVGTWQAVDRRGFCRFSVASAGDVIPGFR